MQIKIDDLQNVTNLLFTHLHNQGFDVIEIPVDYFWHIQKELKYDTYDPPTDFTLGQLSDEWNELLKLIQTDKKCNPINYHLVWLSSIMRVIGEFTVG